MVARGEVRQMGDWRIVADKAQQQVLFWGSVVFPPRSSFYLGAQLVCTFVFNCLEAL
jgi:hypothetical protein